MDVARCLAEEPLFEGRPQWAFCEVEGCIGERLEGTALCLAHLSPRQQQRVFAAYRRGDDIHARGVPFDDELLERLVEALPKDPSGRARFPGHTDFAWARFRGLVNLVGCHFTGLAYFGCATFSQGASFSGSSFEAVSFHRAKIFRSFHCNGTRFTDGVSMDDARLATVHSEFNRAVFEGPADYRQVVCAGPLSFDGATFESHANFGDLDSWGPTSFSESSFARGCSLDGTRFRDEVRFERCRFESRQQLGPFRCDERLIMESVDFADRPEIRVSADTALIYRTAFPGASFLLGAGSYSLEDCSFDAPSLLGGRRDQETQPAIVSMRASDAANLTLSDVDLRSCGFLGAHNLDRLRIDPTCTFASPRGGLTSSRDALAEEHAWRSRQAERGWPGEGTARPGWLDDPALPGRREDGSGSSPADVPRVAGPAQIAPLYRSLRKAKEGEGDEPGAADLYYGEMEMRRRRPLPHKRANARLAWLGERSILKLYWAVSGYGLRTWRALVTWLVVVAAGAAAFYSVGIAEPKANAPQRASAAAPTAEVFPRENDLPDALLLSIGSSTAVAAPGDDNLTDAGRATRLGLRFLGPLVLALGLLALRGRVKR